MVGAGGTILERDGKRRSFHHKRVKQNAQTLGRFGQEVNIHDPFQVRSLDLGAKKTTRDKGRWEIE